MSECAVSQKFEGHQGALRAGRAGVAQPGKGKAPERPWSPFPVPKGSPRGLEKDFGHPFGQKLNKLKSHREHQGKEQTKALGAGQQHQWGHYFLHYSASGQKNKSKIMKVVSAAESWQEAVPARSGAGLHKKSCLSCGITY